MEAVTAGRMICSDEVEERQSKASMPIADLADAGE
jgi:hypothetical protein